MPLPGVGSGRVILFDKKERVHLQNFALTGRPNPASYALQSYSCIEYIHQTNGNVYVIGLKFNLNHWYRRLLKTTSDVRTVFRNDH